MIKRILFLLLNFNLAVSQVLAVTEGGSPSQSFSIEPPTRFDTIEGLIEGIAKWLTIIAAPIATIMILVGAYQILFSAGDPVKVATGRKTILYTIIAYAIILIGWGIASVIKNFLGIQ